ncbi:fibronectin type III domain-containing protein [Ruminococcus albus]|uniref:Fibronectin type III domain protein n=1 Tax=Ruminococcus albus 8 TaxID=246199 RepID=E9SHV3_RUMAL|nr:fibronectin type III domain-containing protein [Ruminococcus albus]EGC01237.1 fibronectin type III domain protein [Ruminococcus albus 8]MCC3349515.1 fibronectin type III domain-containing protein [Ruminococcus albus 8]
MTNYLVKRTIAGIMAVLTVAGAVPANVGGFLTGGSVISVGALSGEMSESDDGLVCEVIDTFGVNGTDHTYEGADFNVTAAYSERNAGMYTYDDYYYINIASKTDKVIQKVELRAYTVTGTKGFKAVSGEENDCTADTSGVSKKGDIVTITDIGSSSLKVWGGIFTFDQVRVYYEAPSAQHTYGEPNWQWTDDLRATAVFACNDNDSTVSVEAEVGEPKVTTAPTYTTEGVMTYTASAEFSGKTYTSSKQVPIAKLTLVPFVEAEPNCTTDGHIAYWYDPVKELYFKDAEGTEPISREALVIAKKGHDYAEPDWSWTNDHKASAVFMCRYADDVQTLEAENVVSELTVPPTYSTDGLRTYTAAVTLNGKTYTSTKTEFISRIALTHQERVDPTCETAGNIEYWVDEVNGKYFYDANGAKPISDKNDIIIPAVEHSYGKPQWDWSEDFTSASAKFVCANSTEHDRIVKAVIEKSETPATYTADGVITYTAKVTFGGSEYTDIKTVTIEHTVLKHVVKVDPTCENSGNIEYWVDEVNGRYFYDSEGTKLISDKNDIIIPATEHSYGNPQWDWSEDFTSASAKFVCANSEAHDQTVKAVVEKSETPATYTADGVITYTAKVTFGGSEYTDIKTVTIEHTVLKHVAKVDPTCETAGNIEYWVDEVNGKYFYDADGTKLIENAKDIIIPATEHSYGKPKWDWSEDFTLASAKFVCANSEAHDQTVKAFVEKMETPATYTADGVITYTAKVTFGGSEYTDIKTVTIEHTVLKHVAKVDPTCENSGNIEYWFDEVNGKYFYDADGTKPISDKNDIIIPAIEHSYGKPQWDWSEDFTSASAKFVCANSTEHDQTVKAVIEKSETPATYTADGVITYTAKVSFGGSEYTDIKTVTIEHTVLKHVAKVDPTCETAGNIEYWVDEENGKYFYDADGTEPIENAKDIIIPATEHSYGKPQWDWSEDFTSASAKFVCANSTEHDRIVKAVIEKSETPATYTADGVITYTAKVTFGGSEYTDIKTVTIEHTVLKHVAKVDPTCETAGNIEYWFDEVNGKYFYDADGTKPIENAKDIIIPATEHSFGKPQWDWSEDFTLASAKFVCANSEAHDRIVKAVVEKSETPATYTADGVITYTAKVTFGGSEYTDIKTVKIEHTVLKHVAKVDPTCETAGNIEYWVDEQNNMYFSDSEGKNAIAWESTVLAKTGHDFDVRPVWNWNEEMTEATAKFICKNDPNHIEEAEAVVSTTVVTGKVGRNGSFTAVATVLFNGKNYTNSYTKKLPATTVEKIPAKAATCYESGNIEYYAGSDGKYYVRDGEEYKEIELEDTIDPIGEYHTFVAPEFIWNENHTATAKFTCEHCGHEEFMDAEVCVEKISPSYSKNGKYVYMASVKIDEVVYTDSREVIIAAPAPVDVAYTSGERSVKLTWNTVKGAEKYAVCVMADGKWKKAAESVADTFTLSGLKPDTKYQVTVIPMVQNVWCTDFSRAITVEAKSEMPVDFPKAEVKVSINKFRLDWTAVEGAEKYGIAVYQAGKWVVKASVDGSATSYTSPKISANTYKMVVCAKVNGKWDTRAINSRAFSVVIK